VSVNATYPGNFIETTYIVNRYSSLNFKVHFSSEHQPLHSFLSTVHMFEYLTVANTFKVACHIII